MSRGGEQSIWDLMADLAIDHMEKKARGNGELADIRDVYARQLGKHQYRNDEFDSIIDVFEDNLEAIEKKYFQRGDKDIDFLRPAIADLIDGHFAMSVLADKNISDELSNRTYDDMKDMAEVYEDLIRPARSRRNRGDDERGGRGARGGGGSIRDKYASESSRNDRDRDEPRRDRGDRVRAGQSGQRRSNDAGVGGGAWSALQGVGDVHEPTRQSNARTVLEEERPGEPYDDDLPLSVQATREVARRPAAAVEDTVQHRRLTQVEGPDYSKARPFDDFWKDDEHWQAAHLSKWTITNMGHDPIGGVPTFFDANLSIKYLVKNEDGIVREELKAVEKDSRYLASELGAGTVDAQDDRKISSAGAAFSMKALKEAQERGEDITDDKPVPSQRKELLTTLIEKVDQAQLNFTDASQVESMAGGAFIGRARLAADPEKKPRVDFHIVCTPVIVSDFEQLALVNEVYQSNTLTDASQRLLALKPKFDPGLYAVLNGRYGEALLRTLKYQFQCPQIKALDFAKDYSRMLEVFSTIRNASETAIFAQRVSFINNLACQHYSQDDNETYTSSLSSMPDEIKAVIFTDFAAIISVDATLNELGFSAGLDKKDNTGISIVESRNRALHGSVAELYSRLDAEVPSPAKVRVYLTTSDNRTVEILPYAGRTESFILASA